MAAAAKIDTNGDEFVNATWGEVADMIRAAGGGQPDETIVTPKVGDTAMYSPPLANGKPGKAVKVKIKVVGDDTCDVMAISSKSMYTGVSWDDLTPE